VTAACFRMTRNSCNDDRPAGIAMSRPWICVQLGAREHYAVPRALALRGELHCLFTDAWVRPGSLLGLCNRNLRERFHRELAASSVRARTAGLLAFELVARVRRLSGWPLIIARNQWFQSRIVDWLSGMARQVENLSYERVLFSYSYTALGPFRIAKERGWKTVLGQIDPGLPEERIVAELRGRWPQYAAEWQPAPAEYWAAWREECSLADVVVANSEWSKEALLSEGVSDEKIEVVPLAYDAPAASSRFVHRYPATFSKQRPLRVLFLGQANIRKGIQDLVRAAEFLVQEPVVFDVVGPHGPLPQSLPSNIVFHGTVARGAATGWYQEADLFVLPTHSDGFALTQLEAMSHGLPVVATPRCGTVVHPGSNGWIVEPGNSDELAEVIRNAISTPDRLAEMSATAVKRIDDFSVERLGISLTRLGQSLGCSTAEIAGSRIAKN
jgi:glycosyltransferase involved in cell wall biosynthesis